VVHARRGIILAAGAINTPGPSCCARKAGTSSGLVGKRTFLHPTVPIAAIYDEAASKILTGRRMSVSVQHFRRSRRRRRLLSSRRRPRNRCSRPLPSRAAGDAPPPQWSASRREATIALLVDGHHDDAGGTVRRRRRGPDSSCAIALTPALRRGRRARAASMAAPPARRGRARARHAARHALTIRNEADVAPPRRTSASERTFTRSSSPHQMGGCPMGADPRTSGP